MDERKEREYRQHQEFKLFIEIIIFLLTLLFIFIKLDSMVSYADTVYLAEAPSNVGGSNGTGSEGFVIDISSDRSEESNKEQTSDIVNASDVAVEPANSDNNVPIKPAGPDIIYVDEPGKSVNEKTGIDNESSVEDPKGGSVTAENGDEIYVPDSDDDCPVSSAVPLDVEVQEYIWNHCKRVTGDYKNYYAFILGAIQLESEFKRTAIHHNDNGTTDRGLMQINSCNIKSCKNAGLISCTDDLWDIYKNIDCGFHEMNEYVRKFGVCESAYFAYNTGRTSGGSNKNSRVVMSNMAQWNTMLF